MKLGAHMPTKGGVPTALIQGRRIGCEVVQFFVKNNMQWFGKPYGRQVVTDFASELADSPFSIVFGHTGYLINLASPPGDNRDRSLKSLVQEIQFASELGLPFLVMHPGSLLGNGEKAGLKAIVAGLNEVFAATRSSK